MLGRGEVRVEDGVIGEVVFEEDEEVELRVEGEVLAENGGEREGEERKATVVGGSPPVAPGAAVVEVVD